FLSYTILDHSERLKPLIERMVASRISKVAKTGAARAAVAWSHKGMTGDIASVCVEGTRWQRMGVADALSNAIARGHDRPAVLDRLRSLFDDPEKDVRTWPPGSSDCRGSSISHQRSRLPRPSFRVLR